MPYFMPFLNLAMYTLRMESIPDKTETIKYPEIASELSERADKDQAMRRGMHEGGEWDPHVDEENTAALKRIVNEIGWPTIAKVGKKAANEAWLLVQHADRDPEFQKQCLEMMNEETDVDPSTRAYLEDRVRVNSKREQLYGTQFTTTLDESGAVVAYGPAPIEDSEHLDERRSAAGLGPFAEYREMMERNHRKFLEKKQ